MAEVRSRPVVFVEFDGVEYANRQRVELSASLDQITAEATVVCGMDLPPEVGLFTRVAITGGRAAGTSVLRFTGRVTGFEENLYPTAITLHCQGNLVKAKHTKPKTKGGHKLHGKTGKQAVEFILTEAGVDVADYAIDADDAVLGSTITDTDKDTRFLWPTNLSALDMIQMLDLATGDDDGAFRTHDFSPDGKIKREKHSRKPKATADFDFTEGVDIIVPTHSKVSRPFPVDQTIVSAPKNVSHTQSESSGQTPTGTEPVSGTFFSPLIEHSLIADGPGYSAEASSRFRDAQKKKNEVSLSLTTWRDDVILPGKTIGVNALTRLELDDKFVVQGVHLSWDESNHFEQQLDTLAPLKKRQLAPAVAHGLFQRYDGTALALHNGTAWLARTAVPSTYILLGSPDAAILKVTALYDGDNNPQSYHQINSPDAGITWPSAITPNPPGLPDNWTGVYFGGNGAIYVVTLNLDGSTTLYRSTNGGTSFGLIGTTSTTAPIQQAGFTANGSAIYSVQPDGADAPAYLNQIKRTPYSAPAVPGATLALPALGNWATSNWAMTVARNADVLMAAGIYDGSSGAIFRGSAGGALAQITPEWWVPSLNTAISFDSYDGVVWLMPWLLGGESSPETRLARSGDGGLTWATADNDKIGVHFTIDVLVVPGVPTRWYARSIDFDPDTFTTTYKWWHSTDNGVTWTDIGAPPAFGGSRQERITTGAAGSP